MLSFITYKEAPEQLEIVADEQGIDELIQYLKEIKRDKDHIHLMAGNELDPYPETLQEGVFNAKSVRIEYYKPLQEKDIK